MSTLDLSKWWDAAAIRWPLFWLTLLAAGCGLALLLAFGQIVRNGMQDSEARRQAAAAAADALWRCNAVQGNLAQRSTCRTQVNRPH